MLGVAGVPGPAISQHINIMCYMQRQTIKNRKRWAMAMRGAVPGSRLLPTCRAAILQGGSPPTCRAATLQSGSPPGLIHQPWILDGAWLLALQGRNWIGAIVSGIKRAGAMVAG